MRASQAVLGGGMMKIIHTSDWHLGARLHEEDRADEHTAFLQWLLDLMASERPDALVVAGDIFDVKAPSPQAQSLYYGFLANVVKERLCRKVVVTAGNHDNWRLLAAPSRLLVELGVSVVSAAGCGSAAADEVVVVPGDDGSARLVFAAVPFIYDADLANFAPPDADGSVSREDRVRSGWRRHYEEVFAAARTLAPDDPLVATGHCTLLDAKVSDVESERCRRIGGIDAYDPVPLAGADYVALGHLHVPQAVKGFEGKMYYSGSPLRMSFDEADRSKSVNIVSFDAPGAPPIVERRNIPEAMPITTLCGMPGEVKARLAELVASGPGVKRFLRLQLKDFEGEAKEHWAELRALVKGSSTLLLEENDMRPVPSGVAGLRAFAGRGIRQLEPRDVALRKLQCSNRHFSESEVDGYMRMFDEVAGGVI